MSVDAGTRKGGLSPRSVDFRKQREATWFELDRLSDRALKEGLRSLGSHDLRRLPVLYRATLASLSVARKTALDRALIDYLDALCGRAYLAIHASKQTERGLFLRVFVRDFPRAVRSLKAELFLSIFLTALGVLVAISLMRVDPGWYDAFVAPGLAGGRDINATTESLRDALYSSVEWADELAAFASFLFVHNARIGLLAFALGFVAGIPTGFLLFTNGLMLGAFIQLYASRGLLFELLGWILPHGIPEIGAVILCGAAGLHLGRAILMPGQRSFRESIAHAGRRASMVALGCVALFGIAGLIEGILRQTITHDGLRYALATLNALWFFGWLVFGGRDEARASKAAPGASP